MSREIFEPNQEVPLENIDAAGEESAVVEEGELEAEEKVVQEIAPDEAQGTDPELFQGVPEAPLEDEE